MSTIGSATRRVLYHLLDSLSHSRNLKTDADREKATLETGLDLERASVFVRRLGRYVEFKDRDVLDLGCGKGSLSILLARSDARHVTGLDVDEVRIEAARRNAEQAGVASGTTFRCVDFVRDFAGTPRFDVVVSHAAFEHILDPLECLLKIHRCLRPGGRLGALFGPLWWSPYGAHMWGFTAVPWVHCLFPEEVVLRVRARRFRPDEPARRYEDIRGHLNRMSVRQFRKHAKTAGFEIETMRLNPAQDRGLYRPLNGLVNRIPWLGEIGALQLLAVLRKGTGAGTANGSHDRDSLVRTLREDASEDV